MRKRVVRLCWCCASVIFRARCGKNHSSGSLGSWSTGSALSSPGGFCHSVDSLTGREERRLYSGVGAESVGVSADVSKCREKVAWQGKWSLLRRLGDVEST